MRLRATSRAGHGFEEQVCGHHPESSKRGGASCRVVRDWGAGVVVDVRGRVRDGEDPQLRDIEAEDEEPVRISPHISAVLRPHQLAGMFFMWENCIESVSKVKPGVDGRGCILAHSMDLGKTLQVIGLVRDNLCTSLHDPGPHILGCDEAHIVRLISHKLLDKCELIVALLLPDHLCKIIYWSTIAWLISLGRDFWVPLQSSNKDFKTP